VPPPVGKGPAAMETGSGNAVPSPVPAGDRGPDGRTTATASRTLAGTIHPSPCVAACTGATKRTASSDVRTGLGRRWQMALHQGSATHHAVNPF
jgi:hypothetical protein